MRSIFFSALENLAEIAWTILKQDDFRAELAAVFSGEESDAEGSALGGPPGGTGVKEMDPMMHFIGGTMGVPGEEPIAAGNNAPGRDVDEVKAFPGPFQIEAQGRIQRGIVITEHDGKPGIDCAQFIEDRLVADIAEVPDFVDVFEQMRDAGQPVVVGIGDHANAIIGGGFHEFGWIGKSASAGQA